MVFNHKSGDNHGDSLPEFAELGSVTDATALETIDEVREKVAKVAGIHEERWNTGQSREGEDLFPALKNAFDALNKLKKMDKPETGSFIDACRDKLNAIMDAENLKPRH